MTAWPFGKSDEALEFLEAAQNTIEILREIGRRSSDEGLEALASLTDEQIGLEASGASLIPIETLPAVFSRHRDAGIVANMEIGRDADGQGILVLSQVAAERLVDHLMGNEPGTTDELGELEVSAIAETTNIALNAMVTEVAEASGASFSTGVPETRADAEDAFRDLVAPDGDDDHAIVVETDFEEPTSGLEGTMILLLFTTARE